LLQRTVADAPESPHEDVPGPAAAADRDGIRAIKAHLVHRRGITGEGVQIGVIGSTFDPEHPSIRDTVVGYRDFHGSGGIRFGEATHDTAVAEIVSDTAPDSELYLAGIGRNPTPEQYAAAVRWLVDRDVEVIVDSGSYLPPLNGETSLITAAAENASERGVVFVTSAGNYANRHWSGDAVGEGWVTFSDDVQSNALAGGDVISGRVTLRLYWNTEADYDVYLYRYRPDAPDPVVAKSVGNQSSNASLESTEFVDVAVSRGRYYVSIYARDAPAGERTRLHLFSASQTLGYATAEGSVLAPATSDRVIAVGAFDPSTGRRRPYSSLGTDPSAVDVGAPDGTHTAVTGAFYGTSAAAPYVAGTVALIESTTSTLSPVQIEKILEETADVSEGGEIRRVDALAAVCAASATNETVCGSTPTLEGRIRTDG
jgi:subtilisin family serine protease